MFYVKANINDEIEIKVALHGDQIYCDCPVCGKEAQVDEETLSNVLQDGDLAGSAVYCNSCASKHQEAVVMKMMQKQQFEVIPNKNYEKEV